VLPNGKEIFRLRLPKRLSDKIPEMTGKRREERRRGEERIYSILTAGEDVEVLAEVVGYFAKIFKADFALAQKIS